jgi:hypothetical protein
MSLKQLQINMGNTYIMDLQKYSNILCGFSHEQTKPLGQILLWAKLHITEPLGRITARFWALLHITEPLRQNCSKLVSIAPHHWTSQADYELFSKHICKQFNLSRITMISFVCMTTKHWNSQAEVHGALLWVWLQII